jgi:pilus assembly protein CpaC
VSSLDFANGLTYDGFTIPALSTRRVQTEVELQDGSFY